MPKAFPKSFKAIREHLEEIVDTLTDYQEKYQNLGSFFKEWENLYFEALSTSDKEEQQIQMTTIYLIWCQMMAILKEEFKHE